MYPCSAAMCAISFTPRALGVLSLLCSTVSAHRRFWVQFLRVRRRCIRPPSANCRVSAYPNIPISAKMIEAAAVAAVSVRKIRSPIEARV